HLTSQRRMLEGEFRPGGTHREWTDANVLRQLRRRSLARLRREVEPVDQTVLARFLARWHGITIRRRGPDALLDAIEQLQGPPLMPRGAVDAGRAARSGRFGRAA